MFAIHGDLDSTGQEQFTDRDQYIGLLVGKEPFLLAIEDIAEIIIPPPMTWVPLGPPSVDAVFNLRGQIVPVVNLRRLMGLERAPLTSSSRMIVVRAEALTFGLVVDGIASVEALNKTETEESNLSGHGPATALLSGVSKHGNEIHGILDVTRIASAVLPPKEETPS
jgi:purine-binding chemotaxis protein CheW